jgi:hypothetical protein
MSKLHDDLIAEIEPNENVQESIDAAFRAIADRIEGCHGNPVKLSDLCSILREDTTKVANAVVANTPAAGVGQKTKTVPYDAPSSTFDIPRTDVRPGMTDSPNDHRDQVTPPNDNTEAERQRIMSEQTARDRGQVVTVNAPMPAPADKPADQSDKSKELKREPA